MDSGDKDRSGANAQPASQLGADAGVAIGKLIHDLRNFLAPIHNAAEILRMRGGKEIDTRALADLIDRQIAGIRKVLDGAIGNGSAGENAAADAGPGAAKPAAMAPASHQANGKRVLIVDDNAALRISLGGVLHDIGHAAKAAADGDEALRIAREWLPHVVFLDVNMPGLNGYELARMFRSEFPSSGMKLIMLSGDTLSEAARRGAESAGFDRCIDKLSGVQVYEEILADHA